MNQTTATTLLHKAEAADGFQELCKRDIVNAAARRHCFYVAWGEQGLAEQAEEIVRGQGGKASVVVLNPSAEGGMPHTRAPQLICLPAYWPTSKLAETIEHELVHIDQRRRPTSWDLKLRMEGWAPFDATAVPHPLFSRSRLNPDTAGMAGMAGVTPCGTASTRYWAFRGRHVPVPVFVREDKPLMREVETWWYDMAEETASRHAPSAFVQTYGQRSSSEQEHPYELFAYRQG